MGKSLTCGGFSSLAYMRGEKEIDGERKRISKNADDLLISTNVM